MFRDQRNSEDNCRYVSSESSLLIRLFSLIRKTGILYLISKVEYVNAVGAIRPFHYFYLM